MGLLFICSQYVKYGSSHQIAYDLFFLLWFNPLEKLPNRQCGQPTNNTGKVTWYCGIK